MYRYLSNGKIKVPRQMTHRLASRTGTRVRAALQKGFIATC